ncbi:sensor histidine kinase [uncultured Jatrophihabitans sp.]|uniref:sensor histidine kinase n=1 Tax=uncultured Jatrophihabitans sp. TaxID=1610747 RepID=UPI0035CBEA0D
MTALRRRASLRGRVLGAVLAVLVALLVALFVVVDLALSSRLDSDLRARLTDRVALAEQLDGALPAQQLVDRLRGAGVSAQLCDDGDCVQADTSPPPRGAAGGPAGPGGGRPPAPAKAAARRAAAASQLRVDGPVLYVRTILPASRATLTLSVDRTSVSATVRRLVALEAAAGAVALLLAALVLAKVIGTALRPLDAMSALARRIAGGHRGQRLQLAGPRTELGRVGTAFNAMLDELESALATASRAEQRQRAFLDDVSHELRTPIAGLQATAESLLRDELDPVGRERAYVTLIRETRRAARLVEDLLTMTRLDLSMALDQAGVRPVDLVALAREEAGRVRLLAPQLTVAVSADGPAVVWGDAGRLGQVLANLLANALTAAGPSGRIEVHVRVSSAVVEVDVADDGPGVADADRERIFQRLVRVDAARARDGGGFGLGLPIARALARAHGGDVLCLPAQPDSGATFRLRLPAGDPLEGAADRLLAVERGDRANPAPTLVA